MGIRKSILYPYRIIPVRIYIYIFIYLSYVYIKTYDAVCVTPHSLIYCPENLHFLLLICVSRLFILLLLGFFWLHFFCPYSLAGTSIT